MVKQEIPLDIEIIFKKVNVSVWQKGWMERNGISWNDEDKTMMRASMVELKEKLEIVGEFRGSSEVRNSSGVMGGSLYSSVLHERMKVPV